MASAGASPRRRDEPATTAQTRRGAAGTAPTKPRCGRRRRRQPFRGAPRPRGRNEASEYGPSVGPGRAPLGRVAPLGRAAPPDQAAPLGQVAPLARLVPPAGRLAPPAERRGAGLRLGRAADPTMEPSAGRSSDGPASRRWPSPSRPARVTPGTLALARSIASGPWSNDRRSIGPGRTPRTNDSNRQARSFPGRSAGRPQTARTARNSRRMGHRSADVPSLPSAGRTRVPDRNAGRMATCGRPPPRRRHWLQARSSSPAGDPWRRPSRRAARPCASWSRPSVGRPSSASSSMPRPCGFRSWRSRVAA